MELKKAVAEGYKYCVEMVKHSEEFIKLKSVVESPEDYKGKKLLLCDKEPQYMTVEPDEVLFMFMEKFDNQEDFYSEVGFYDALEGTEDLIKSLCLKINNNLKKKAFYFYSSEPLTIED